MRKCTVCGEENPEAARFCNACGERLEEGSPDRFRRTVTVLFSDVVDSTGLGERLDPETLSHVLTDYFEGVRPVVERHGGTLAKFIGDAVMAVFGLTELHEDDALRAARAAVEMRETLTHLNVGFEQRYGVALATRTGINTGLVAGKVLAPDRGLMVGDTSTTAARLQQTAKPGEILLSESTYKLVRGSVEAELLAPLQLKGKRDQTAAYLLVAAAEPSEVAPRPVGPLVGRQDALAQLQWALERTIVEERCRIVSIVGAPGVGKSRLAHEFVLRFGEGATVLRGRCLPYGEGITFWPLTKMVKQAAGIHEDDPAGEAVAKLEVLLQPEDDARTIAETIGQLTGLIETTGAVEEGFWAVRAFFARLARTRPVIAVVDDAHWAEPTLLALLEHVARHTTSVPILLICVSRPELLERRPDWGEGAGRSSLVRLEPLDQAACDRLIAVLLGEAESALDFRDRIAETAGGNPLFIEQMIWMLIDDGLLENRDGRWVAVRGVEAIDVPPGIHALLAARLERLGSDERAVLGRAAVMGQTFYVGAIEALASPPLSGQIRPALLELVGKELIRPRRSDFVGEEAFEFRHLLIRDAAYDALSKEDRADLHALFADWMERSAGDHEAEYAEIIGWHLEQAHRYLSELGTLDDRGVDLGRRAADRLADAGWTASARGDVAAGVTLRSRALALMPADAPRRLQLQADLGDALLWGGRFEEAGRALAEAIELADRAGDEGAGVRARLSQMRLRFQIDPDADYEALEHEALEAAEHCGSAGDDFGAARAWRVVYWARWGLCQLERMRPAAERAYEHDLRARDPHYPQVDVIGVLVSLVWGPTPASEALVRGEKILETVQGHRGAEAHASCFLGQLRGMLGQREAAREMILQGVVDRQELGDLPGAAMSRGEGLGYFVEMVRGDWEAGERELRQGYEELASMGDKNYLAMTAGWLAHCVYQQGRWDEADEFVAVCEGSSAKSWVAAQVLWKGARAMLLARRGDVETGEALAREAVGIALRTDRVDTQTDALMDLAEVLRVGGRGAEAVPLVTDALRRYERKEVLPAAARARSILEELTPTVAEGTLA
ncbi:MAG TPA: adenylate/guanylate cyclase domain-containing protein [Actinomycetota bacterium]|nr:adenylate/guanylate cyclase domain-containing protein [Actinomycetota bacterium]